MIFKEIFNYLYSTANSPKSDLMVSGVVMLIFMVVYFVINHLINLKVSEFSRRRSLKVTLRNLLFLLMALMLISVWAGQIKTVVVSTAALSAAIIITFKDVLLSFFASFFITSNKLFTIGDEVEYDGIRGKVLDKNFFGIKIQAFTATENKIVFIPNIVFLTSKIINFSKVDYIKFNYFPIKVEQGEIIHDFISILEREMNDIMKFNKDIYEEFKKTEVDYFDKIIPKDNYYIKYNLSEENQLQVYYFAKKQDRHEIEKKIAMIYFKYLKEQKENANQRV